MIATKSSVNPVFKIKTLVPGYLVRDLIDGLPLYYKGYREVLAGTKTKEEIMGCSTLQSFILLYLIRILDQNLDEESFHIFTGESGNHLSPKTNFSLDLAVYDTGSLPVEKIDEHYAKVPPVLVVEVDVKMEPEEKMSDEQVIRLKTDSLLKYGVQKVVWFLSRKGQVFMAEKGKKGVWRSWHEPVELMPGIEVNVGSYLKRRGHPAGLR
ncbi:MAG: Uma2 family endonuclease [Bacteroidota bacterium]